MLSERLKQKSWCAIIRESGKLQNQRQNQRGSRQLTFWHNFPQCVGVSPDSISVRLNFSTKKVFVLPFQFPVKFPLPAPLEMYLERNNRFYLREQGL
jgi:hypothetical protein